MASGTKIRGITIEIGADTTKLKASMEGVNKSLSQTKSALRDTNSLLKFNPASTDLIKQKQGYLKDAIEQTNQKIKAEKAALEEMQKSGDTTKNQEAQKALKRDIEANTQQLKKLQEEYRNVATVAGTKMQAVGSTLQGVGDKMTAVGTKMTTTVTLPLAAVGTAAVKTTADFDSSMSKVQAISGATGEDFQKLRDKAREMGSKTKFSASEAADGMTYMAMAGWKTEDMLDGLDGVMNLAAASGEDLATTSDIVTDALTAFGLSSKDSGHFADVLAAASSNANTNVSMMGETFKYAAPIAGSLGYSVEDTAVAIGLMANAGIKGSQAGTALRTMLTKLSGDIKITGSQLGEVTIKTSNADGSMRDLSDILGDCRSAFSQLTESEKANVASSLVGQEAMSGFLAIMNAGQGDVDNLTAAISNCDGTTQRMADDMQNNLGGQLQILKSQLEEVAIQIGDALMPTVKKIVEKVQEWVEKFSNLDQGTKEIIVKIGLVAAAIGPLLVIGGKVVGGIGTIVSGVGRLINFIAGSGGLIGSIGALANPIGIAIAAIGALVAGITLWSKHCEQWAKDNYALTEEQKKQNEVIHKANEEYDNMIKTRQENVNRGMAEIYHIEDLMDEYNSFLDSNGKVKKGYEDRAEFIVTELAKALGIEKDALLELRDENGRLGKSVEELIETKKQELLLSAMEDDYREAIRRKTEAQKQYIDAQEQARISTEKYNEIGRQAEEVEKRYQELLQQGRPAAAAIFRLSQKGILEGEKEAKQAYEESMAALDESRETFEGYNATVKNYEGYASAIISKDADQIHDAQLKVQYDYKDTETVSAQTLRKQVEHYEAMYKDIQAEVARSGSATAKKQLAEISEMLRLSRIELGKTSPLYKEAAEQGANAYTREFKNKESEATRAGSTLAVGTVTGLDTNIDKFRAQGFTHADQYVDSLKSKSGQAHSAGQSLAGSAKSGAQSAVSGIGIIGGNLVNEFVSGISRNGNHAYNGGQGIAYKAQQGAGSVKGNNTGYNFGIGFANGMSDSQSRIYNMAFSLGNIALNALMAATMVHSPSRAAAEIGNYFGEGFSIGIDAMNKPVKEAAVNIGETAIAGLNEEISHKFNDLGRLSAEEFNAGLDISMDGILPPGASHLARPGSIGNTTNNSTTNMGGISIVVNGAPGQDVNELADIVSRKITAQTHRRRAAFS